MATSHQAPCLCATENHQHTLSQIPHSLSSLNFPPLTISLLIFRPISITPPSLSLSSFLSLSLDPFIFPDATLSLSSGALPHDTLLSALVYCPVTSPLSRFTPLTPPLLPSMLSLSLFGERSYRPPVPFLRVKT
jgi:hypothetical protein